MLEIYFEQNYRQFYLPRTDSVFNDHWLVHQKEDLLKNIETKTAFEL
jgi:hypothetical protein